jgi:AcrR family transcriptional regulator
MTGRERREQLIGVGRKHFADKGFEGTTIEEIAASAGVSKPVVYEHFGGKEGLYAVVVDREIESLLSAVQGALTSEGTSREIIEQAALALLGLRRDLDRRLPDPRAGQPHRPRPRAPSPAS